MYGLTDERYRQLHNYGNADCTIEGLIRFYGLESVQKGYPPFIFRLFRPRFLAMFSIPPKLKL